MPCASSTFWYSNVDMQVQWILSQYMIQEKITYFKKGEHEICHIITMILL